MKDRPDTPAELKQRALRYLVRREHSRAELARKLAAHAESSEAVQLVLEGLLSKKQLSDERFASERARVLSRKYGPAKIRQDLKARGVAEEVIDRLSPDDESARARAILARKYREPAASREERARRARFLQGRGFSYEAIKKALSLSEPE
ncbi:MAG TPA: regulatory protein RecX [Burkholderiales bacterium]|jgi:regulatory protein|nr:regulatory protein RecX [Burkholderiales bacterium]